MDDAKAKAILGGSQNDVIGRLGDLSSTQLREVGQAESNGKNRPAVLTAIDAALEALKGTEHVGGAGDGQPGNDTPVTYTQSQVDQMLAQQRDAQAAMFTREQVDQMIAERDTFHAAEKDRAVAEATGATAAAVKVDQSNPLTIGARADNPSLAVLTGVSSIVFVDASDRPLPGLPAMTFAPNDFEPVGNAVTLKVDVEFPKEIPATEVAAAFLLDDEDEPVGRATLVMPFAIGGGRTTRLAKSTLQFAQ